MRAYLKCPSDLPRSLVPFHCEDRRGARHLSPRLALLVKAEPVS